MPTITLGHVLMLLAAIAVVAAVAYARTAMRYRGFGIGTPQYARERMSRRLAVYALVLAVLLGGLCFTPLRYLEIVSAGA